MKPMDELAQLLAAERAARVPDDSGAGLERLLTSLAAKTAPLPIAVGAVSVGWGLISKCVALGFVIGVSGAGAAAYASAPTPRAAVEKTAAQRPSKPVAFVVPSATPTEPQVAPELEAPHAASERGPVGARKATPDPNPSAIEPIASPSFDEELRLIRAAKSELDRGRGHLAETWLTEHATRFPSGVFSLEREGLRVLARCAAQPDPALARAFATRHPESPMIGQLQRRCSSPSATSTNAAPPGGEPTQR